MKKQAATRESRTTSPVAKSGKTAGEGSREQRGPDLINLPEVTGLTVTVITDNYTDSIRADVPVGKRYRSRPGDFIHAAHGLSFYIETLLKKKAHGFMFDYGPDAYIAIRNMELLDINPRKIDSFGLSHGHLDHWGGLVGLLKHHGDKIRVGTPLYVGGETFAQRYSVNLKTLVRTDIGRLKRKEIESLGTVEIREIKEPTEAIPGCWLTGDIERVTEYEKGTPTLLIRRKGKIDRDFMVGEQGLVSNVKGKGLVVISGCAHAGIVNTVKHAQKITGIDRVHAIVGGLHLVNSAPDLIKKTIADIQTMKPDYVVATHCTGFEAMAAFAKEMPDQFIVNTAGTQYTFSA
jgi:7,8-dihydropterin-6-yl-methyl-4-(beta-D-ribofuranosyl)aminobenzene 5'-phosphate synthase